MHCFKLILTNTEGNFKNPLKNFTMNKMFSMFCLMLFSLSFSINGHAQCTTFNGGPYTNLNTVMPNGIAPCDPNCGTVYTITAFEVWSSEAYVFYGVIEGNSYTVDICTGAGAGSWVPELAVGPYDGTGISTVDGSISGNCSLTFTASASGDYLIVINTSTVCGGAENQVNGGNLSVQCNGAASCTPPTCGNLTCDTADGENYCSCNRDCDCPTIDIPFIDFSTGGPAISTTGGFAYCADSTFIPISTNPIPEKIYVPIAIATTLSCVPAYDVATSHGILSQSDGTNLSPITSTTSFVVFYVELTQADVDASGGTVTVTVTDTTTGLGECSSSLAINVPTLNQWNTDVASSCPGVCAPPDASFVSYDCAAGTVTIDVTDPGIPTSGSAGFTWSFQPGNLNPQLITAAGSYTFVLPNQTEVWDLQASDGVTDGCTVGFFNNPNFYGDCLTAGPGCTDVIADGGFELGSPNASWTESSVNGDGTPTGAPVIDSTLALSGTYSAFLGGFGDTVTTSITQTVNLTGNDTLYFWVFLPLTQASHTIELSIGGTVVMNTADFAALAGLNWRLISIPDPAPMLGSVDVVFTVTEDATGSTFLFVDEVLLNCCPADCGSMIVLSGTESGTVDTESQDWIRSTQTITSSAVVDYDATDYIDMDPNFCVMLGAEFHAFIDGCGGAMRINRGIKNMVNSINMKSLKAAKKQTINLQPFGKKSTLTNSAQMKKKSDKAFLSNLD